MKINMNSNENKLSKVEEESINEYIKSNLPILDEKDLPEIITGQFSKLKELEAKTEKAKAKADKAKAKADKAKELSVGWFNKKIVIENLQSVGVDLADAVGDLADAQKVSFEFQDKLGEISKYLFGLGASNIAINRFIVRELELRLKDASEEELSELARQELIAVVKQLKSQEDILKKQEDFKKAIKSHDEKFILQLLKIQEVEGKLDADLQGTNSKIDDIEEKLASEIQTYNTKIQDVEGKLNSKLQTTKSKIDDVEGRLNTDLDVAFSKLQAVEDKADSELTFSNVEIKKNRKMINLLMILVIVNIVAVISLIIFFTKL